MADTPRSEKLSITLPADMVAKIRAKVEMGRFTSNSEVIRESLRGWLEREATRQAIEQAIERGLEDAKAGRVHSLEDVRRELLADLLQ